MSNTFVDNANAQMGAIERLLKGLPGIKGYVDKDLRRDGDKRVRDAIAAELDADRSELLTLQQQLLKQSGLGFMTDMDTAITRLQTLADRVKHANYGYAGLFDPVRIKENELDALYRFDVAMVQEVGPSTTPLPPWPRPSQRTRTSRPPSPESRRRSVTWTRSTRSARTPSSRRRCLIKRATRQRPPCRPRRPPPDAPRNRASPRDPVSTFQHPTSDF